MPHCSTPSPGPGSAFLPSLEAKIQQMSSYLLYSKTCENYLSLQTNSNSNEGNHVFSFKLGFSLLC